MLSLLKRKADAGNVSLIPPWHPDFRNRTLLPDIKVVRTAFFVNGVSIFIAVALLVSLAAREYELYSLNSQIKFWQTQIDRDRKGSAIAVDLYKRFQDEEKRLAEVTAWIASRPDPSLLLQRLGETRPRNIAFDYVEVKDTGIIIRGVVRGASEVATGDLSAYLELLKKDPILGPKFEDPQPNIVTRTSSGRLRIEILLKFRAVKK